jgi:hypothetical protein
VRDGVEYLGRCGREIDKMVVDTHHDELVGIGVDRASHAPSDYGYSAMNHRSKI